MIRAIYQSIIEKFRIFNSLPQDEVPPFLVNKHYDPCTFEFNEDYMDKYFELVEKDGEKLRQFIEEIKNEYIDVRINQAHSYQEDDAPDYRNSILGFLIIATRQLNREGANLDTASNEVADLSSSFVITYPWKQSRTETARKNIQEFKEDKLNHKVTYLKGVDMFVVTNGNHSIARGLELKQGKIICNEELDVAEVLKDLNIDFKKRKYIYKNKVLNYDFDTLSIIIYDYKKNCSKKINSSDTKSQL